mgnify:CR=1 FL=1
MEQVLKTKVHSKSLRYFLCVLRELLYLCTVIKRKLQAQAAQLVENNDETPQKNTQISVFPAIQQSESRGKTSIQKERNNDNRTRLHHQANDHPQV